MSYELVLRNDTYLASQYEDLRLKVVDIIVDDNTVFEATDFTKRIRNLKKVVDEKRKEAVSDYKQLITDTEKPFKEFSIELDKLDAMLSGKLMEYQKIQKAKEQARLEAERQERIKQLEEVRNETTDKESKENLDRAVDAVASEEIKAKAVVKSIEATASLSEKPKYEIIDPALVPREFCSPDAGKIWAHVRGLNTQSKIDANQIPGVKIWLADSLSIR